MCIYIEQEIVESRNVCHFISHHSTLILNIDLLVSKLTMSILEVETREWKCLYLNLEGVIKLLTRCIFPHCVFLHSKLQIWGSPDQPHKLKGM